MRAMSWLDRKGKAATTSHSGRRLFSHSCEAASDVLTPPDAQADTFSTRRIAAHYMRAAVRCQLVSFIQQLGFDTVHSPDTISDHALFYARML